MILDKKYYDLYIKLNKEKSFELAEKALNRAILLQEKALYYYDLAILLRRKGQWWQVLSNLEKALALNTNAPIRWTWAYLGALEKMNHFSGFIKKFETIDEKEIDATAYFRYGSALENEENVSDAKEAFIKAIEFDDKNNSKELGIGAFYEKKGDWINALKYYKKKAKDEPFNTLLHYKLGLSYDRNYEWEEAAKSIRHAITLDGTVRAYFIHRLAFNYERNNKFLEASEVYTFAISKDKVHNPYNYYRLGFTLNKAQNFQESCKAFLKMKNIEVEDENIFSLTENKITVESSKRIKKILAPLVEGLNDLSSKEELSELLRIAVKSKAWSIVESIYKEIILRDESVDLNNYVLLAEVLYKQKKYKEASQNFVQQRILQHAHSITERKLETDKGFNKIVRYAEYLKSNELLSNTILYESNNGKELAGEVFELFLTFVQDKQLVNWRHVLIINQHEKIHDEYRKMKNVLLLKKDSTLYLKYLAQSEYLINNMFFPSYFIRQDGQKYLNFFQKIEVATENKSHKDILIQKAIVSQDLLHSSHIVTSDKDKLISSYSLNTIYTGKIVQFDYNIEQIIDFLFFDNVDKYSIESSRKSILIYASFEPNGITSALLNLLNVIDTTKYCITLIIDNNTLEGYENIIEKLSKTMNVLIRLGRMVVSLEEQWIQEKFTAYNCLENEEMKVILSDAFSREFRRMFGKHKFDNIIDFNGYRVFWVSLFAFGNACSNSIYLHNDMYKEYILKYPSFSRIFYLYKSFDKLISVSKSVFQSNQKLLASKYKLNKESFHFSNNLIDFRKYKELGEKELSSKSYKVFSEDKRIKFINIGRLSPEKGQLKLIESFAKVYEKEKNIALYIMGTGVLENEILSLIKKYKLERDVILLGYQENPYPFIQNSDCMILTSLHEGQALVLLEALYFSVPCISTNIAGPKSVLENGYGLLVGESIDEIVQGIENFLNKNPIFKNFNSVNYNEDALNMFYKNLIKVTDKKTKGYK